MYSRGGVSLPGPHLPEYLRSAFFAYEDSSMQQFQGPATPLTGELFYAPGLPNKN